MTNPIQQTHTSDYRKCLWLSVFNIVLAIAILILSYEDGRSSLWAIPNLYGAFLFLLVAKTICK